MRNGAVSMSDKKNNFNTDITDEDELDEIKKIAEMLNPDERILVVAKDNQGLNQAGLNFHLM